MSGRCLKLINDFRFITTAPRHKKTESGAACCRVLNVSVCFLQEGRFKQTTLHSRLCFHLQEDIMAVLILTAACHAVLTYYTGPLATLAKCSEFHTNSHPENTRTEHRTALCKYLMCCNFVNRSRPTEWKLVIFIGSDNFIFKHLWNGISNYLSRMNFSGIYGQQTKLSKFMITHQKQ